MDSTTDYMEGGPVSTATGLTALLTAATPPLTSLTPLAARLTPDADPSVFGGTEATVLGGSPLAEDATTAAPAPAPASAQYPYNMLGFTAASAFIIAILGTFGNLLTIIALPMAKKLRTTATAFVVNLAVVELLFCVFILPMSGAQYLYLQSHHDSLLTHTDCVFFVSLRYSLTQVELQTILAIALTRALAVSIPRLYQNINRSSVIGVYIAVIWVYSVALKMPPAFGLFGQYGYNSQTMECDMVGGDKRARLIYIVVEAIIPVLLIFILYFFVFIMVVRRAVVRQRKFSTHFPPLPTQLKVSSARVARSSSRGARSAIAPPTPSIPSTSSTGNQRKGSTSSFKSLKKIVSDSNLRARFTRQSSSISQRLTSTRRDLRVARTIFIIFLLVLVCSVPVAMVHAIDRKVEKPVRFLLLHVLYWVQYCLNLVVYVLMNRQYRDAYVDCLSRVFPRFKRHQGHRFFWEKASMSSRPQPNLTSTRPNNPAADSSASEADQCGVGLIGTGPAGPERLTAIPEGHSSSAANDSVFSDPAKKPLQDQPIDEVRKEEANNEDSEGEDSEREGEGEEQQTLMDRELWVNKNGATAASLPDSEAEV